MAIVCGGGCEVVRANASFARAAGVLVAQLAGLRCSDHAFGQLPCPTRCAMPPGGAAEREVFVGDRTWMVRSFPLEEGGTQVLAFKDVTIERAVSRRLYHAEKMSAVGQLAGGVAHELNNPLGGILAFAQLMSRDEGRTPDDQENLRLITDAALRGKRIVESLLHFSRRPREEKGPVELAGVVDAALFLLQSQLKSGRVEVVREYRPAVATANANQVQQIVVNLLVNALQAMSGDGRIVVSTGPAGAGQVRLQVADSGPGVEPEVASRVFEPFFTTKPEGQGTGLGLAVCYQIAEEHGGSIRLEQPQGRGATFVVELPAAPSSSSR
jgi:two-component system NtrC family sensor kinase